MYDYLILTAAITRPDLHAQLFRDHLNLIGGARVKWLINVDDVGNGNTVEQTIHQLTELLQARNIDLEFLTSPGPGCFFSAANALAARAAGLLDQCRIGVVWLEDDWALYNPGPAGQALNAIRLRLARNRTGGRILRCPGNLFDKRPVLERHEELGNGHWFVSLVPRSRVSFNPGIWSRRLFEDAFARTLADSSAANRVDDPETLCADPLNEAARYARLDIFVDPRFQDAGRLWSALEGLHKWRKDATELQARRSVTYAAVEPHDPMDTPHFNGTLLCPDLMFGTSLRVLARIQGRRLTLPGVPFLRFDLVPAGQDRLELFMHRLHGWSRTYPVKRAPVALRYSDATLQFEDRAGTAETLYCEGFPLKLWWRLPLQALLGTAAMIGTLGRLLVRLDAE